MTRPDGADPDVSVVLPAFNERDNIAPLVTQLRDGFRAGGHVYEIIVVDDRSPDGTGDMVEQAFGDDPGVRLIRRTKPPGLAVSIRDGVEAARGEIIVVMDTDFNHLPADAVTLFKLTRHVDLAIGSRFIMGGGMSSRTRYFLSYLFNIFVRLMLGSRMDENLSGIFAIKADKLRQLDFDKIFWGYGDYFFRLLLLSQKAKFVHLQFPVYYGERLSGESKTRFLGIFTRYTREVLYLAYMRIRGQW